MINQSFRDAAIEAHTKAIVERQHSELEVRQKVMLEFEARLKLITARNDTGHPASTDDMSFLIWFIEDQGKRLAALQRQVLYSAGIIEKIQELTASTALDLKTAAMESRQ